MTILRRLGRMFLVDIAATAASVWLAFLLRFEGNVPNLSLFMVAPLFYAAVSIPLFMTFGLYRPLWRYSIVSDYLRILPAVTAANLPLLLVRYFGVVIVPYGVIGINWLVSIFFVGGARAAMRFQPEFHLRQRGNGGINVLIVGAGEAGANIARELQTTSRLQTSYNPIGFVDDDPAKKNMRLSGLKVLGDRREIARLVREHEVKEVFIAMPSAPRHSIREIVLACREAAVPVKILPGLFQLIDGQVSVKALRDVAIEDLLPRPPVSIDLDEIATYLRGEIVLVTGAGGSIGSELCRQISRFNPKKLLLLGRGENSIYEIHQELIGLGRETGGRAPEKETEIVPLIADVRDRERLQYIFERHRPGIVFHAAAHKHVPLMEDAPGEAVKNNIYGTLNAAELAHAHQAKSFVLVSTDKAVKPASVMGATKRVAELIVQDLAAGSRTRFCAVRFGNVLGSRGSVVPLFQRQIAMGGPVTITDTRMTRYFMTIPEAVSLIIQAGAMGRGGEIFVLDMGEPVKIVDLARELIRLCGLEPDKDVKIVETGIRPGEKLFEEILTAEEGVTATRNERIFVAKPHAVLGKELARGLSELLEATGEPAACVERLMDLLPRQKMDERMTIRGKA